MVTPRSRTVNVASGQAFGAGRFAAPPGPQLTIAATVSAFLAALALSGGSPSPPSPPPPPSPSVAAGARQATLVSTSTGTKRFALGFSFRQADIPAGVGITVTDVAGNTSAQATPKNYWPDGSVKFAVLAGSTTLAAGVPLTLNVNQGTATTGTALTTADLQTAIGSVTVGLTGAKDWTFTTASKTVGAELTMTDGNGAAVAGTFVSATITSNNGATVGTVTPTASGATKWIITAPLSGGTEAGLQTVTFTLNYTENGTSRVKTTTTVAYVRTGGGIEWDAGLLRNTYAASNNLLGSTAGAVDVVWSGSDWLSPHEQIISGHRMSSWVYRKVVGTDPDLKVWLEVRHFLGGATEVLPWTENGSLTGTAAAKIANFNVTIGGTSRFNQSVEVKHHARPPLLASGGALTYWLGADPEVTFAQDMDYFMSTQMVPHYGPGTPSSGTLTALPQSYTPNTLAGISSAMSAAGGSGSIIHSTQALYITSRGDVRAWKAAQVFGYSGGSWSVHFRDATTNQLPRFQDYPTATLQGGSPSIGGGTGGENGTAGQTHQTGYGYLPYLMTGRWWFLEEQGFWTIYNHFAPSVELRRGWTAYNTAPYLFADGRNGIIDPRGAPYSNRGAHWSICRLAQTLAILPTSHACFADFVASWEANANFYKQVFVDGTFSPGWVSSQGLLGDYSSGGTSAYGSPGGSTAWWGAGFMHPYAPQAWGHAARLGLPISSTARANTIAVRNQAYKVVVQRAGDGLEGRANWRQIGRYDDPIGTDGTGLPPESWFTAAESFAEYRLRHGLGALDATPGLPLVRHQSNSAMTSSDSTGSDYAATAVAALALAVDDNATDANAGWLRVSGSSNFNSGFSGLIESPAHWMAPQAVLPAFRPAPGTYRDIPYASGIGTMKSVAPVGFPNEVAGPFVNWSTAKIMPPTVAYPYGLLVVRGSGHLSSPTNPLWDGWWCLPLDGVSSWFYTHIPTPLQVDDITKYDQFGQSIITGSVGYPYPGHMYWGMIVQPPEWGGGPKGSMLHCMIGGWSNPAAGPGGHGNSVWRFDMNAPTTTPTRVVAELLVGSANNYPSCIEDFARGGFWTLGYTGNSVNGLVWTQFDTWVQTTYPGTSFNGTWYNCLIWIPERSCLVAVGAENSGTNIEVRVCPVVGGVPQGWSAKVSLSGAQPNNNRIGGEWVPDRGQIMMHEGNGSNKLHWLTPPDNLVSGNWVISEETQTGVLGATPITTLNPDSGFTQIYQCPPMARMRWSPPHKAAIWSNSVTRPAQIWTPLGV